MENRESDAILREEIRQLSRRIEELETALAASQADERAACGSVERLEALIGSRRALQTEEVDRWRDEARRKSEEVAECKLTIARLEEQVETEAEEYAELAIRLTESERQLIEVEKQSEALREECRELRELGTRREENLTAAADLSARLDGRERELEIVRERLKTRDDDLAVATDLLVERTAELAELREMHNQLHLRFRMLARDGGSTQVIANSSRRSAREEHR